MNQSGMVFDKLSNGEFDIINCSCKKCDNIISDERIHLDVFKMWNVYPSSIDKDFIDLIFGRKVV